MKTAEQIRAEIFAGVAAHLSLHDPQTQGVVIGPETRALVETLAEVLASMRGTTTAEWEDVPVTALCVGDVFKRVPHVGERTVTRITYLRGEVMVEYTGGYHMFKETARVERVNRRVGKSDPRGDAVAKHRAATPVTLGKIAFEAHHASQGIGRAAGQRVVEPLTWGDATDVARTAWDLAAARVVREFVVTCSECDALACWDPGGEVYKCTKCSAWMTTRVVHDVARTPEPR